MNKGELVTLMMNESEVTRPEAEKALNLVIDSIITAMKKGNDISLIGFGSFYIREREARKGRNPKTGKPMDIAAYKQPIFRAGKRMKEACN